MRIVYRPTLVGGAVLSFQCWSTQEFVGNSIWGQLCLDRLWLPKDWGDWSLLVLLYNLCVCVFKPRTLHALARVTLLSHNPRLRVWILMSLKGACVGGTAARKMIVDSDTFRCWLLVRDPRTWGREIIIPKGNDYSILLPSKVSWCSQVFHTATERCLTHLGGHVGGGKNVEPWMVTATHALLCTPADPSFLISWYAFQLTTLVWQLKFYSLWNQHIGDVL